MLDLTDSPYLNRALAETPVEKVWGVGLKTAIKLKKVGIKTASALRDADINWVRRKFGVVGAGGWALAARAATKSSTGSHNVFDDRARSGLICMRCLGNLPSRKQKRRGARAGILFCSRRPSVATGRSFWPPTRFATLGESLQPSRPG